MIHLGIFPETCWSILSSIRNVRGLWSDIGGLIIWLGSLGKIGVGRYLTLQDMSNEIRHEAGRFE